MRQYEEGKTAVIEFDSVHEITEHIRKKHSNAPILRHIGIERDYFGDLNSKEELWELGRTGWEKDSEETMRIAEDTVTTVEKEFDVQAWSSIHDVSGSDVDIDRYLTGIPENMISYQMIDTTKTGKVVTLAVNVDASGMVEAKTIEARGKFVTALVFALERLGFRTEIYAESPTSSSTKFVKNPDKLSSIMVKVKDAVEILDPAIVMFALTHPGFLRGLCLPAMHSLPEEWQSELGAGYSYGYPTDLVDIVKYPQGTLKVNSSMYGAWNSREAEKFVTSKLKELGLIED